MSMYGLDEGSVKTDHAKALVAALAGLAEEGKGIIVLGTSYMDGTSFDASFLTFADGAVQAERTSVWRSTSTEAYGKVYHPADGIGSKVLIGAVSDFEPHTSGQSRFFRARDLQALPKLGVK